MIKEEKENETQHAQYMMVSLRDDRSIVIHQLTTHIRGRIPLPQPQPRARFMVPCQGWMVHTWWSTLCNRSQVGNKSFTSPLEKVLESKGGSLALNHRTTAGVRVLGGTAITI